MMRVNRTWPSGAKAMAVPGCPEWACWGASMARPRITAIPNCYSARSSLTRPTVPSRRRQAAGAPMCPAGEAGPSGRRCGPVPEQRQRGGEPVQEGAPPHRPQLASGEAPDDRPGSELLGDDPDVVVGAAEEPAPAPVAGEEHGGIGPPAPKLEVEIVVGTAGVAQVELDRGADRHHIPHHQRTAGAIHAHHRADE